MDPLLALRSLAAHVKESVRRVPLESHQDGSNESSRNSLEVQLLAGEVRLDNASGLDPGPEHILLGGYVVRLRDAVQRVEVVTRRVVQLIFARTGETLLYTAICPEFLHQQNNLWQQDSLVGGRGMCEELTGNVRPAGIGKLDL